MTEGVQLPVVRSVALLKGTWESVERHFNIVLLGDGYRQADLAQFATHCKDLADGILKEAPFDRFVGAINIFRMDVVSRDSYDSPALQQWHTTHQNALNATTNEAQRKAIVRNMHCSMPWTNTAFGARFCQTGEPRLVFGNEDLAAAVATSDSRIPYVHAVLVILNTTLFYGGAAGKRAAFLSRQDFVPIALHELGHHAFGLEDEYHYESDESEAVGFTGGPPQARNVSVSAKPDVLPWSQLLTTTDLPTNSPHGACRKLTADELKNGTFAFPASQANSVGAFEGAATKLCGIYRPMVNCKMRASRLPFCAVCEQVIVEQLATHVFDNARTRGELEVDLGTQLLTFIPPAVNTDRRFMIYDVTSGRCTIYSCAEFVRGTLPPTPNRCAIAAFWNVLAPVTYLGQPHILAAQRGTGAFALYRISEAGDGLTFVRGTEVPAPAITSLGFLSVVPFSYAGQVHYLEYDVLTGDASIKRIEVATPDPITVRTRAIGRGRIGFTRFSLQSGSYFYSYDFTNGTIELHRFDDDDIESVWSSPSLVGPGWTELFVHSMDDGTRYLILYSQGRGVLRAYRVRSEGQGLDFVYQDLHAGCGPFTHLAFKSLLERRSYVMRYRWPMLPGEFPTMEALQFD